jgi:hypothetical protein
MRCKIFYDCEFLEGARPKKVLGVNIPFMKSEPTIDLISIGMVSEAGDIYYGISNEFDLDAAWADQWIKDNVLKIIYDQLRGFEPTPASIFEEACSYFTKKALAGLLKEYGKSRKEIRNDVINFVRTAQEFVGLKDDAQLYGYYSAYDHVVLCWLFGRMIDLPKGFPMYTTDLKQMFDEINAKIPEGNLKSYPDYPRTQNEHDALSDALWNLKLFKFLTKHNN